MFSTRRMRNEGGTVLPVALLLAAGLVIGAAAFLTHTSTEVIQVRRNRASVRAFYYAEAGLNYAKAQVLRGWQLSNFLQPFHFIDNYHNLGTLPASMTLQEGTPEQGYFYAEIINVSTPYHDARDVMVKSTGMYQGESRTVVAIYCLELRPAKVFDYTYFLNHWGWTEGIPSRFKMWGNIRANGYFSFSHSTLYENGNPEYKWFRGDQSYKDSGGIYSGFQITGASSLSGMGSLDVNQHMNEDTNENGILDTGEDHNQDGQLTIPEHVPMPNLTQMNLFEQYAQSWNEGAGSSIKIEGAGEDGADLLVSNAVYGDEPDEKGNLVLWGTQENPIVIDGPVVVRGGVIIKGYVKGKGSLYVQDNVYIPDNVRYVNSPEGKPDWDYFDYSDPEVRYNTWTAAASQWRQANADKDGLGLFARESVVIGDFTVSSWRSSVDYWLNHSANESAEATNGFDHMPNTDDEGEGDGKWTVDYYTQQDLEAGLIPPGSSVGDVVPESGEDIDGDGQQDGRIAISDFDLPSALNRDYWGGWTPEDFEWDGTIGYTEFTNEAGGDALDHIDALLYTNHATVANWGRYSPKIHLLGGIVSRIEAIVLRNDGSAEWIHDERFTGGGEEFGFILPKVKAPMQAVYWAEVPYTYGITSE